jgi:hypothetical protein
MVFFAHDGQTYRPKRETEYFGQQYQGILIFILLLVFYGATTEW